MKKADLIVAAGEKSPDLRYLTGLSTPDDFIYFSDGEVRSALMSRLEFDRARRNANPGIEIWEAEKFGQTQLEQIVSLARDRKISSFRVPADFPLLPADRLRKAGLTLEPVPGLFAPEREFKTAGEVAEIVRALRVTEDSVRRAFGVLGSSSVNDLNQLVYDGELLTSERLRQEIEQVLFQHGAIPENSIVAGGVQSACPHETGHGPLHAGEPIVMDIFPRMSDSGYWGDLTRTVVKGRAPEIVKKAFSAVLAARELAKTLIKPGADPAEIHRAAAASMEDAGFATGTDDRGNYGFFHGLGHGVGLEIHELPRLSPGNRQKLKGGEVVTDEPGLYYPEWGGIRLEDMILVTPSGAECLTELETFLEIE